MHIRLRKPLPSWIETRAILLGKESRINSSSRHNSSSSTVLHAGQPSGNRRNNRRNDRRQQPSKPPPNRYGWVYIPPPPLCHIHSEKQLCSGPTGLLFSLFTSGPCPSSPPMVFLAQLLSINIGPVLQATEQQHTWPNRPNSQPIWALPMVQPRVHQARVATQCLLLGAGSNRINQRLFLRCLVPSRLMIHDTEDG